MLSLGVTEWVRPLVSSNTQANSDPSNDGSQGAPVKDEDELTDEGQKTRDKK
jgi:hypothetical protein